MGFEDQQEISQSSLLINVEKQLSRLGINLFYLLVSYWHWGYALGAQPNFYKTAPALEY